jgi:hypothetical protein
MWLRRQQWNTDTRDLAVYGDAGLVELAQVHALD